MALEQLLANNPMLQSGVGLWAAGMATFALKDIPARLYTLGQQYSTTTLTVSSNQEGFHALLNWLESSAYAKNFRSLRVTRTWTGEENRISVGFGSHFFRYKGKLCWLSRERVENKNYDTEEITVSYLGRDQTVLRDLLEEAFNSRDLGSKTRIYTHQNGEWLHHTTQEKRPLSSVLLSEENHKAITTTISNFLNQRDWYIKHGIPYKLGICLYGPPGTGKTSLVKALCAEYNLRLCAMDLAGVGNAQLRDLMRGLEKNSLLLAEDIDTVDITRDRESSKSDNTKLAPDVLTLGGILNAFDGVIGADGRILVVTTNKLDKLDPALVRPGRIDLALELGYMTPSMFRTAMKNFFPDFVMPENIAWPEKMTPATFQQLILANSSPEGVLKQMA